MMKIISRKKYYFLILCILSGLHLGVFAQGRTIIQGQVKLSDGSFMKNSTVFLVQFNPATKICTVMDSAFTDIDGKYTFYNSMQYYILAQPDASLTTDLPTYYGGSLFAAKASPVAVNIGDPVNVEFFTSRKATNTGGSCSLGGSIVLGKNSRLAASKTMIFLADQDKNPVAATNSDANGSFLFKNLANGTYYIWADLPGLDNSNPDPVELNNLNPNKETLHLVVDDGVLIWNENSYTSIKEALASKDYVYSLNLNSLQHDVAEKSLVIAPDGTKMLSLQIGEFKNLEHLSIDINMISFLPADLGKLTKLTSFSASLNKVSTLPDEMSNLKNLKSLNLGKNNFNKFPDLITGYPSLEVLNFENNPIPGLPTSIGALKNLKSLNLASCFDLLALPTQIGELTNLEELNLSNCVKLKALPKELNNLKNLKVLDITGTKLNPNSFKKAVPNCEIRMTKK